MRDGRSASASGSVAGRSSSAGSGVLEPLLTEGQVDDASELLPASPPTPLQNIVQAIDATIDATAAAVRRRRLFADGQGGGAGSQHGRKRGASPAGRAAFAYGFESLDYEPIFNSVTAAEREQKAEAERHFYGYTGSTLTKWAATILIGAATGAIAFVLEYSTTHGLLLKNGAAFGVAAAHGPLAGFAVFMLISLLAVTLPCLLVQLWAPEAAGAGVMLVMVYLNGNHVPDLLRPKTLITKV